MAAPARDPGPRMGITLASRGVLATVVPPPRFDRYQAPPRRAAWPAPLPPRTRARPWASARGGRGAVGAIAVKLRNLPAAGPENAPAVFPQGVAGHPMPTDEVDRELLTVARQLHPEGRMGGDRPIPGQRTDCRAGLTRGRRAA